MAGNIITDEEYQNLVNGGFEKTMVNELKQLVASINSRRGLNEEKIDYDDLKTSLDFNNDYLFDGNFNMADDNQRREISRGVLQSLERMQRVRETPSVWRGGSKKRKTNKKRTNKRRKTNKKRKTHKTKRRGYKK
jgi:hypothetical protein